MTENKYLIAIPKLLANFNFRTDVNKIFHIDPVEICVDNFKVPIPNSHIGHKSIQCRLLSKTMRNGMVRRNLNLIELNFNKSLFIKLGNQNTLQPSRSLIFHTHGGGFISQTSKSHELYLREVSDKLDVPILSIDYSLAPEAPYPRALEEVFYVYCWALNNREYLGSTLDSIIFVGDSAGALTNSSCVVKCIESGIRIPDRLINIYGISKSDCCATPSRFLSIFDPCLPYLTTSRLIITYSSNKHYVSNVRAMGQDEFEYEFTDDYIRSPFTASDDILKKFPPTSFVTASCDPCQDDSIEFAKKLKKLKVDVSVKVIKDVIHGFLYYTKVSCIIKIIQGQVVTNFEFIL